MKLIESKAEYLPQALGLEGIYKQIELAGRTAYKSEDKITEDSASGFVDRMIKSHHGAVLEHGTVYLNIFPDDDFGYDYISNFMNSPCSNYTSSLRIMNKNLGYLITTNLRVIVENNLDEAMRFLMDPTEDHEKRYTMKFTCDRGVSHELVRHRAFSFLQESTRYCNYSKGKFGEEITFIEPSWEMSLLERDAFMSCLSDAESHYMALIDMGWKPQQARQVLPNALKTEVIMTGFASDWKRLLRLRLFEETGKVHPDMKVLMEKLKAECIKNEIWEDIINSDCKEI